MIHIDDALTFAVHARNLPDGHWMRVLYSSVDSYCSNCWRERDHATWIRWFSTPPKVNGAVKQAKVFTPEEADWHNLRCRMCDITFGETTSVLSRV